MSCNGVSESPFVFPYKTQSPTLYDQIEFRSIDDVWEEVKRRVDETRGSKFSIGTEIWSTLNLYADPRIFITDEFQNMIEDYNICKQFNIPLAQDLDSAPADRVIAFRIIEEEIIAYRKYNGD